LITLSPINTLIANYLNIIVGEGGQNGGPNSGGGGGGSSIIRDDTGLFYYAVAGGGGGGGVFTGNGGTPAGNNALGFCPGLGGNGGSGGAGGVGLNGGGNGGNGGTALLTIDGGSGGNGYDSYNNAITFGGYGGLGSGVGGDGSTIGGFGTGGGGGGYGGGGGGGVDFTVGGGGGGGGGSYFDTIFFTSVYSTYTNSGGNGGRFTGLDGYVTITYTINPSPAICLLPDCDVLLSNFSLKNITEITLSDEVMGYLTKRPEKIKKIIKNTHAVGFLEDTNKPYLIERSAFGPNIPDKDIHLSGHHRIITQTDDNHFVGVQTFKLDNCKKVVNNPDEVTYYHILLENSGVGLIVNNLPVEDCIEE
jgi:hypothetical protein